MQRAWVWVRGLAGAAVIAAAAGSGVVALGPRGGTALVRSAAVSTHASPPVAASPAPPELAPAVAPAQAPPPPPVAAAGDSLHQPAPPPADPYAAVPVTRIGELEVPSIGLVTPFYEGIWLTVLDVGPGHWPGTADPGGYGNLVIAGHRVTHGGPFRNIDRLAPGDPIVVRTAAGTFTYRVTGSRVVTPAEVDIVDQQPGHTITLFACHPPGSARYRYVVTGTLVS